MTITRSLKLVKDFKIRKVLKQDKNLELIKKN